MNILIRVNDDKSHEISTNGDPGVLNTSESTKSAFNDGGAPRMEDLSFSGSEKPGAASGADDIGGPPSWLFEKIKEGKENAGEEPAFESGGNDAGKAPEF